MVVKIIVVRKSAAFWLDGSSPSIPIKFNLIGLNMKAHPVYNNFIVHKDGKIFSTKTNKFIKTRTSTKGYETFSTRLNGRNGKALFLRVHRLVAETYIENIDNKPFINHIDGNKLNNNVDNLEWVTSKENMKHAYVNNLLTIRKGEESTSSKLTEVDIEFIRNNYKSGSRIYGSRALGKKYGVDHSTILSVVNRDSWKHI